MQESAIESDRLCLNLGSRAQRIPGFKNIDFDPEVHPDFICDVADLSRFGAATVHQIYASHVLEHFSHIKIPAILKEWHRVLIRGGTLYVAVPDFARISDIYRLHGMTEWLQNYICGDQGNHWQFHLSVYDQTSLTALLKEAGFAEVSRLEFFGLSKTDCSTNVYSHDRKPVSLNMVAIK